jgi:hypothetical protein
MKLLYSTPIDVLRPVAAHRAENTEQTGLSWPREPLRVPQWAGTWYQQCTGGRGTILPGEFEVLYG